MHESSPALTEADRGRIAGVVLAGGRGSRMGSAPKVLMRLGGTTLLQRALSRASPQVGLLCLSSNLDKTQIGQTACDVLPDSVPGYRGPLAGVCTAMEYLHGHAPEVSWLCSFAADTPWFPVDLVSRLMQALRSENAEIAVARSGARKHPVFALWPVSALGLLRETVALSPDLSTGRFQSRFRVSFADWGIGSHDPFFNLNTPEDFNSARSLLHTIGDIDAGIG